VLSVDNMKASMSGRETLHGAAEPGRNLLETNVFDGTKSVRAKNSCNAIRLETAVRTFTNFRDGNGSYVPSLANEIDDRPALLPTCRLSSVSSAS
jgi:hypothetical protein